MAHQVDKLVKVGLDGFALLDELYPRQKKPDVPRVPTFTIEASDRYHHQYYNHNNQQQCVYRYTQVITVREPVIDNNQTVQFFGCTADVDHSMGKPIPRAY